MNNWLRNIQGQITDLASEVMQEATEEVEDPESELQVERKKAAESERLLVVERSKNESLEKRVSELDQQLYTSNLENDAIRERFEHMVEDRDAQIRQLAIDCENMRDEVNSTREKARMLQDALTEREAEIAKLSHSTPSLLSSAADEAGRRRGSTSDEAPKSTPPSEAGTEESSHNGSGWEKMGTEWTAPEAAVGISSASSESCPRGGAGSDSAGGLTIPGAASTAAAAGGRPMPASDDAGSQQSSPSGGSGADDKVQEARDKELREAHAAELAFPRQKLEGVEGKLREALTQLSVMGPELEERREVIDQLQRRIIRLESELDERGGLIDELTALLAQKTEELREKDAEMLRASDGYGKEIASLRAEMSAALASMQEHEGEGEGAEGSSAASQLRDDELDSLKCQLEQLEEKRIGLEAQVENLRQEKEVHALQISQLTQQLVGREHALEKSRERASQLEREMAEHRREEDANEGSEELISELKSENAELKESLEAESTTRASLEAKAKVLEKSVSDGGKIAEAEVQSARQQVTSLREEVDRKDKELMRLKEHLLQIEELSTREAILAEERETELRKELRFLQETSSTYTSSAAKSENSYKREIASLRVQLVSAEESVAQLKSTLSDREKSLNDVTKSLTSLQSILQELGDDHVKEIAQFEEELRQLRAERKGEHELNVKTTEREAENRRLHEAQLEGLNAKIARLSQMIESLESQLEETLQLQAAREKSTTSRKATTPSSSSSSSSYQIDDATLRQLFMSYLLAESDKQPEIAMVMSSILGYSQEEQALIQETFSSEGLGSWFGFGGRRSTGTKRKEQPSLTEQFIRFLENESRTIDEQPTLPIPEPSQPRPITGVADDDGRTTSSSSNHRTANDDESSSDLKSILES